MHKKRRLITVVMVCYLLFFVPQKSFSNSAEIKAASSNLRGVTIHVSLITGYERNKLLLEKLIPEFKKLTGIDVQITFVSYNDVLTEHEYILSANSSKYDLLNVDNIYFPKYVDHLEPIENYFSTSSLSNLNEGFNDFIPELLLGYQWKKKQYCIPETFEAPILMVRKDLWVNPNLS